MEKKNILVVSGCMAIQSFKGNILPEELYPSILKETFLKEYKKLLIFEIITYNELHLCYERIIEKFESKPADLIIFQVRGHYYLNIVNFLSTYKTIERTNLSKKGQEVTIKKRSNFLQDTKSKLRKGNNFASIYIWEILVFIKHRLVMPIGYLMGYLFGAESFAKEVYTKLIINVLQYAEDKKIPIIFLGVTSRPNCKVENLFARRLNRYSEILINSLGGTYISIFGKFTTKNEYKFINNLNNKSDKISLSKIGHREVAEKLAKYIQKLLVIPILDKSGIDNRSSDDIPNFRNDKTKKSNS